MSGPDPLPQISSLRIHMPSKACRGTLQVRALLLVIALAGMLSACASSTGGGTAGAMTLRVGVSPEYPPIIFEQQGKLTGLEVELANALGERLGRPVKFVKLERSSLIPALETGEIDIVMSGMSVTPERAARVHFIKPYLRVGQLALIREDDLSRLSRPRDFRRPGVRIGYVDGTTGETYVTKHLPNAESYAFANVEDGVRNLRAGRLDVIIHDAPTVWRIGGGLEERQLMGLYHPLTDEYLAWAVPLEEASLKVSIDSIVDDWRMSGALDSIINQWIPVRVEVGSQFRSN